MGLRKELRRAGELWRKSGQVSFQFGRQIDAIHRRYSRDGGSYEAMRRGLSEMGFKISEPTIRQHHWAYQLYAAAPAQIRKRLRDLTITHWIEAARNGRKALSDEQRLSLPR